MKNRIGTLIVAAVFVLAAMLPATPAVAAANESNGVRQGEFALLLVNVLGLYRFLPAAPSEQESIAALLANGIHPANGWEPDKPVVLADLAEILVRAMDRADEVADPSNPQSWIDYLASVGVPIDTIGLALTNVEPLMEPFAGNVANVTTDPLRRRSVFGLPDETESGTDMSLQVTQRPVNYFDVVVPRPDIVDVVVRIPDRPPRPRPVTPD